MKFEFLPNELLLDLFEYLKILHIFRAFYNLNSRFNTLIHCRKCRLDLQSISKTDFDIICKTYLSSSIDRILSLRLSEDDKTPQEIGRFLSYGFRLQQFTDLQTIVLSNLHSPYIFDQFITECFHLPSLTHLTFINCHISIDRTNADRLYNQLWSLSKLSYCYIDINFANRNYFPMPTIISTSIRYLLIPNISCYLDELIHLSQSTPNLQDLSVDFIDNDDDLELLLPEISITRLKISFDSSLNVLKNILRNKPDLYHLTLETCNTYMNGYQWEEIIRKYLPKLKIFQIKMRFSSLNEEGKQIQSNEIFDSFRTKFWIDEHQWFVRCHWYASDEQYRLDFIDLFTLPYAFKDFLNYTGCTSIKSTCPYDDEYWLYDHVTHLCYGSSHFTNSLMSRIRFSNIEDLSLSLPFNDQFLIVVSKLDRLISLSISINNNKKTDDVQSQLQILLDRASRLYSLSLGSWSSSCLQIPLMENKSKSIRCLNLHGYACGKNWRYFDDEQCIELSRSPLGIQCETLLIKVQDRRNILDLVNNMPNLQALNVQCDDDHWTNVNDLVSLRKDELIEWLRQQLPSTCTIARNAYLYQDIRLWIR